MKDKRNTGKPDIRIRLLLAAVFVAAVLLLAFILSRIFPEGSGNEHAADHAPDYVKTMYLKKNPNSRPGDPLTEVRNVVIHYTANPGTSAEANRNYFNNLASSRANPSGTQASSHFIVGLSGEVIQCIPMTEIAYANYPRNGDTVSVEVCHPDDSGKFSDETYQAVVTFAADLLTLYRLEADDLIRHYDISEKLCPKYYVEHPEAWEQLREDVRQKMNGGTAN